MRAKFLTLMRATGIGLLALTGMQTSAQAHESNRGFFNANHRNRDHDRAPWFHVGHDRDHWRPPLAANGGRLVPASWRHLLRRPVPAPRTRTPTILKRTPPPQVRPPPATTTVVERYIRFLPSRHPPGDKAKLGPRCHDEDHVARVNRERYKLVERVPADSSSCPAGRRDPEEPIRSSRTGQRACSLNFAMDGPTRPRNPAAMDNFIIAGIIHVVAVLFWIGGVAFVTTVVMPSIREGSPSEQRLAAFHRIEGRFAWQARIWVAVAGASGFWMVYRAGLWSRYADPHFWWMHAMLIVWLLFATMLFVIEPLFLHRRMANSSRPPDFRRIEQMHWLLLILSLIAVVGAIGGSHGLF